jgi:hypothetical protein
MKPDLDRTIGGVLHGCAVVLMIALALQTALIWIVVDWILSK